MGLANEHDPSLISVMNEVRQLIEPSVASWAAVRATASDLVQIESALEAMKANCQNRVGTHSKWMLAENAMIEDFPTVMTGELHLNAQQKLNLLIRQPVKGCLIKRRTVQIRHALFA